MVESIDRLNLPHANDIKKYIGKDSAGTFSKVPVNDTKKTVNLLADDQFTTFALYEEGGGAKRPIVEVDKNDLKATTLLLGESGSGFKTDPNIMPKEEFVTLMFNEGGGFTTQRVGEEGGNDPIITTQMIGEEGGGNPLVTTQRVGEEGGDPIITTQMIGEDGGNDSIHLTILANLEQLFIKLLNVISKIRFEGYSTKIFDGPITQNLFETGEPFIDTFPDKSTTPIAGNTFIDFKSTFKKFFTDS